MSGDASPFADGVARLARMPPLQGFTDARWATLNADAATLLEQWGDRLRDLGWTASDVFGVLPDAPWHGLHGWGLAIVLDGSTVVALTADSAVIRRPTGARHTFTRRYRPGAVPIWDA